MSVDLCFQISKMSKMLKTLINFKTIFKYYSQETSQAEQNMVWNKRKIHELGLAKKLNFLSMHQAEKLEQPCQIQMSTSFNSLRSLQFLARQKLAESLEIIFLAKAVNTKKQTAFPKHCHVSNLRREPELLNNTTASPRPVPPAPHIARSARL